MYVVIRKSFAAVLLSCLMVPSSAFAQRLYWTTTGDAANPTDDLVQRSFLDGTFVQTLVATGLDTPLSVALNLANDTLYFTDASLKGKVFRAALDGRFAQAVVTEPLGAPAYVAVDPAGGKIYWSVFAAFPDPNSIRRADLDGSNMATIITFPSGSTALGIALDLSAGKLYWCDTTGRKVQRSNLDGTVIEDIIVEAPFRQPVAIAIDPANDKIYWTDNGESAIRRANRDGTNPVALITTGISNPGGIALDIAGGKMYWSDEGVRKLSRANLDGTGIEDLVTAGLRNLGGVALDLRPETIPAVSTWGMLILVLSIGVTGAICIRRRTSRAPLTGQTG